MPKFSKFAALAAAAGLSTAALAQDTATIDLSQLLAGGVPGVVVSVIAFFLLGRFFLGRLFNWGGGDD